jgi:predicted PurR-regulated permease PerM
MKRNKKSKPDKTPAPAAPQNQSATKSDTSERLAARDKDAVGTISMNRLVSFGLLLTVIILLSIVFYKVMASFLIPMFLAALLVVIFDPFHQWFLKKCNGRETLAAALTTLSIMLTVLVPIGLLLTMAVMESQSLFRQYRSPQLVQSLVDLRKNLKLDSPLSEQFRQVESRFDSLHLQLLNDDMDKQRIGISEIYQTAAEIAEASELQWSDAGDAEKTEEAASSKSQQTKENWALFQQHIAAAREIDQSASWELSKEDSDVARSELQRHENLQAYKQELSEANAYFEKFKVAFLGGRIRALFTQAVNPSNEQIESYVNSFSKFTQTNLPKLGGATSAFLGSLLLGTSIMIFSLYFFLLDGERMIKSIQGLSPLDDQHEVELIEEFGRVSRAVAVATLLSAVAQGLLAGIGFYVCGLESVFSLTLLSAVLAMVPFVGAASVWIPCCLYLYFVDQNLAAAIGLAIYGFAVISMADNIIKPIVLHGQSNLHPLLALLSVIGGVSTLGPIGIVIGPMVVVFLQTLLKILRRELDGIEHELEATQ